MEKLTIAGVEVMVDKKNGDVILDTGEGCIYFSFQEWEKVILFVLNQYKKLNKNP